jgi:hypothetical protein
MKFTALLTVVALTGVSLAAQTAPKTAPAKTATASKLPAAVAAAFKKAYPNATIKNASSEREDGKLQWEVESMDGTSRRDLIYLPDGTLVVEELTIDAAAVPAPVMAALKTRYPKATVSLYEKLTKPTSGVSYEMQIKGAAVKEVEIAPDGTFISPKPVSVKK